MYTKQMIDLYTPQTAHSASPYPNKDANWLCFMFRLCSEFLRAGRKAKVIRKQGNTYTLSVNEYRYTQECECNTCIDYGDKYVPPKFVMGPLSIGRFSCKEPNLKSSNTSPLDFPPEWLRK